MQTPPAMTSLRLLTNKEVLLTQPRASDKSTLRSISEEPNLSKRTMKNLKLRPLKTKPKKRKNRKKKEPNKIKLKIKLMKSRKSLIIQQHLMNKAQLHRIHQRRSKRREAVNQSLIISNSNQKRKNDRKNKWRRIKKKWKRQKTKKKFKTESMSISSMLSTITCNSIQENFRITLKKRSAYNF